MKCPKPKMETKWSRFAKLKGITKKKKGRLVWSDDLKVIMFLSAVFIKTLQNDFH